MPRFTFLPAEQGFYDWFDKGAANLVEAARLLNELLRNYSDVQAKVAQITETEHRGDFIVHEINDMLHRTRLTPIGRESIQRLAGAIDDVVDNIDAAADLMLLYKIEKPTPTALRLGEIIIASVQEVNVAVPLLRHKRAIEDVRRNTIEVNRLENEADQVTRAGMAILLEHPEDILDLIRWKDIYAALEEATDRCEDVADELNVIVIEAT